MICDKCKQNVVNLICQRCSYNWSYRGKNQYVTSCPKCKTSVMINNNNKVKEKENNKK